MSYTLKTLPQSQVELTITVTPNEYEDEMKKGAVRLSQKIKIKGFRPGKAPYDIIKKEAGEMAIMQEAIEYIVRHSYHSAVVAEKLPIIGQPEIKLEKFAPGNDIIYSAVVALLPKVEVADIGKITITKEVKKIEEKDVDETLEALRGMQATEVIKTGKSTSDDKVVLDMDMFLDKVPVEGGQAKDYQVYLSEQHYIPGFNEKIVGIEKGEEREFTLDFPKTHYQKNLAGKTVTFKVTAKDVFERKLPEINDDFAKKVGQQSLSELRGLIQKNRQTEEENRAEQKAEIELLEKMIENSKFEEIPEVLITSEKQKMFYELKGDLEKHNVTLEKYLEDLKKTEKQLLEEFTEQSTKRAKAALLSRQIAINENLTVEDKELDDELKKIREMYKDNPQAQENLKKTEVIETIATTIQNRKVMDWMKKKVFTKE